MKFKVVLYESAEGFTVFCPGLNGCISEGDTVKDALDNITSAIREYMEAAWLETKEQMNSYAQEEFILNITMGDVEVDLEGVEETEPEPEEIGSIS